MSRKINNSITNHCLTGFIIALLFMGCANKSENRNAEKTRSAQAEPGWQLLFDGKSLENWEVTQFGTQGPVQVSGGSISLGMGEGCTGITWKGDFPLINYEVQLEAKKVTGNDFFCGITFPVGNSFCSFIAGGWGGPVVGLSTIDGNDASENETRVLKKFEHDIWYKINLKVSDEKIEAWIDNEKLVDFNTTGHQLSIRPEVALSKPFGICSWVTTAELRNIQLKHPNEPTAE
jgi:hypothetical protein